MLGHKTSLKNFNKLKHTKYIFWSQCNETKNQQKKKHIHNMWKLNNILLNNHWVKEKLKGSYKILWDKVKWKYNIPKVKGAVKAVLRGKTAEKHLL